MVETWGTGHMAYILLRFYGIGVNFGVYLWLGSDVFRGF